MKEVYIILDDDEVFLNIFTVKTEAEEYVLAFNKDFGDKLNIIEKILEF